MVGDQILSIQLVCDFPSRRSLCLNVRLVLISRLVLLLGDLLLNGRHASLGPPLLDQGRVAHFGILDGEGGVLIKRITIVHRR